MTGIYGIKDRHIIKLGYYYSGSYMRGIYSVVTLRNAIKRQFDKAGLSRYKPSDRSIDNRVRDGFRKNHSVSKIYQSYSGDLLRAAQRKYNDDRKRL